MARLFALRSMRGAFLLAVPVVALALLGLETLSSPLGKLPPTGEAPTSPSLVAPAEVAKDSPVLDVKTWQETAVKTGNRR